MGRRDQRMPPLSFYLSFETVERYLLRMHNRSCPLISFWLRSSLRWSFWCHMARLVYTAGPDQRHHVRQYYTSPDDAASHSGTPPVSVTRPLCGEPTLLE
jgi:hypothetical protein